MVRTVAGHVAVEQHAIEARAASRTRVLLAGDLRLPGAGRPSLLERLGGRLRRSGDVVMTTSSRPERFWRAADMLVTTWSARTRVDVAVVEVNGAAGLRRAEVLTGLLTRSKVPVVHLLRGASLADAAQREPDRVRRLLASGAASVALSGHLHEALAGVGGVTTVIADPVDAGAYPFRPRSAVAPKILWVCSGGPKGAPEEAAEVLRSLVESAVPAEVTFVAPASALEAPAQAERAAQAAGVGDRLQPSGPLRGESAAGLLHEHDLLVNAADVDDAPIGIAEAMAAGMCVISVDWGGASYLVNDRVDGLLVRPRDPGATAAAVASLLAQPELAERLSRAARTKAEGFDWSHALPRWRSLLARTGASAGEAGR